MDADEYTDFNRDFTNNDFPGFSGDDERVGETSFQQPASEGGYFERITEICESIDSYLDYISNYVDSLMQASPQDWQQAKGELEGVIVHYDKTRNEAFAAQNQIADDATDQHYVNTLAEVLDFVTLWANNIGEHLDQVAQAGEQPLAPNSDESALMVSGGDVPPGNDVVVMEDVGPVTAWWRDLSPGGKLLIKALGVGVGLYVGKKVVYDPMLKSMKKKASEEPAEE